MIMDASFVLTSVALLALSTDADAIQSPLIAFIIQPQKVFALIIQSQKVLSRI